MEQLLQNEIQKLTSIHQVNEKILTLKHVGKAETHHVNPFLAKCPIRRELPSPSFPLGAKDLEPTFSALTLKTPT